MTKKVTKLQHLSERSIFIIPEEIWEIEVLAKMMSPILFPVFFLTIK